MLKQELDHTNTRWARLCDSCHSVPCTVYCRTDSAYLCTACDTQIHQIQSSQDHERVWVCEACEQAPAAFLCKADAASLCASCDADIHSANPLASRHHRVPILPVGAGSLCAPHDSNLQDREEDDQTIIDEEGEEDETASWLLLNTTANKNNGTNQGNIPNNGFALHGEVDRFLGFFEFNSGIENHFCQQNNDQQQHELCVPEKNCGGDSVVPVQCGEGKRIHYQSFLFGMEFETKPDYNSKPSLAHSLSISSLDVGVVPESTVSHPRPPKGTIDLFSGTPIQMPTQLSPLDREARVMRYREKKKTRRFEKTIRYASRKAYAETRPRIKGRFAKRSDVEAETDQMCPNSLIADSGYGIVPSL